MEEFKQAVQLKKSKENKEKQDSAISDKVERECSEFMSECPSADPLV